MQTSAAVPSGER